MYSLEVKENRESALYGEKGSVLVKGKLNDEYWKAKGIVKSVSKLGASFEINNHCKVGQIVSLLLPMPINLRFYDHDKELYKIWGLVQQCNPANGGELDNFHVGVAFIGDIAPDSFYNQNDQYYRITGLSEAGFWNVIESKREFVNRRHPRFWVNLDGELYFPNQVNDNFPIRVITENISLSGAAVFCESPAKIGDTINFSCPQFGFESQAVVRNRKVSGNAPPKIHLEFLENTFPVANLGFSDVD